MDLMRLVLENKVDAYQGPREDFLYHQLKFEQLLESLLRDYLLKKKNSKFKKVLEEAEKQKKHPVLFFKSLPLEEKITYF